MDERLKLVECLGCDECEGMTENNVRDVTQESIFRALVDSEERKKKR